MCHFLITFDKAQDEMIGLDFFPKDDASPMLELNRKSTIRSSNLSSRKAFEGKVMGKRSMLELMMQTQTMLEKYDGTKLSPKAVKKLRKIDVKAWCYFDCMVDAMEEIVKLYEAEDSHRKADDRMVQLEAEVFTPCIVKLNMLNRKRAEVTGLQGY